MSWSERYASDKPWNDEDPDDGKHSKLSPEQKAKAKARAKAHDRPYPNWVDNAWASKHGSYSGHGQAMDEAIEVTGHEGVPGEGIHPDYEGIDICMKCPGHTTWPCKVVNNYLDRR